MKIEDVEEAMKSYDKLVYNVSTHKYSILIIDLSRQGEVLESEDIASAIVFALSAPPRMEVSH